MARKKKERDQSIVGLVMGQEPSNPFMWHVAIHEDSYLQLGDVVFISSKVPGLEEPVRISGLVAGLESFHEGAQFDGDIFRTIDGGMPVELSRRAMIQTTRVEPEVWVSPLPGDQVRRATGAHRDEALYFDAMYNKDTPGVDDRRLIAGSTRDKQPFYVDYDFLSGVRGAHVNISGISGVATKTSYACFLLYSLLHSKVMGTDRVGARSVIFNVKGEDLLHLDKPNSRLTDEHRAAYKSLGLEAAPFSSVSFWAPPRAGVAGAAPVPDTSSRQIGVTPYYWTIQQVIQDELLHFMFAEGNDTTSQISDLAIKVERQLKRVATPMPNSPGAMSAPADGVNKPLRSFDDLIDYVTGRLESEERAWTGGAAQGTVAAFIRRLESAKTPLGLLIQPSGITAPRPIDLSLKTVTVVDINRLHDRAKRFVVGVVLHQIFHMKEQQGNKEKVFVVLDELNKYAPREGNSSIKDVLLDIAERGRSLGIILFGAEQTASEVERRIVSNAAIRVVGRLDSAESMRPEYGFLDQASRARAALLKSGTMLVLQPHVPIPVEVVFPMPSWATRDSEVKVEANLPAMADDFREQDEE